jgi:hypothetical protein
MVEKEQCGHHECSTERPKFSLYLGACVLWKHRNRCVFDAATPSLTAALTQAGEERLMWEMAGARCMPTLTTPLPAD